MTPIRANLLDMQKEAAQIARFTQDGEAAFWADERTQYAVMMAYTRLGQLAKETPDDVFVSQPQVPWAAVKGLRDVLAHQYRTVNMERVWEAVEALPELQSALEALLSGLPPEADDE